MKSSIQHSQLSYMLCNSIGKRTMFCYGFFDRFSFLLSHSLLPTLKRHGFSNQKLITISSLSSVGFNANTGKQQVNDNDNSTGSSASQATLTAKSTCVKSLMSSLAVASHQLTKVSDADVVQHVNANYAAT